MPLLYPPMDPPAPIGASEWTTTLRVLRAVEQDPSLAPPDLERLVARLHRAARRRLRRAEAEICGDTPPPTDKHPCLVCGETARVLAVDRPGWCLRCADQAQAHRHARADLRGRVALVTGGRLKLGLALALKLLRDGAEVHVTTRHPDGARATYAAEPDAADWWTRLHLHALDLREPADALRFAEGFGSPLDLLVHNAAQTLRDDADPWRNSWTLRLGEVPLAELLEVLAINAAAPFALTQGLLPALRRSTFPDRYVISVVGADGQFGRPQKTPTHPHVNASKAALSMVTRTSAEPLAREGIYLCCVDPGWFSLEQPPAWRAALEARGRLPPLDTVDAAARVYHPVRRGLAGDPAWGVLLRDYQEAPW